MTSDSGNKRIFKGCLWTAIGFVLFLAGTPAQAQDTGSTAKVASKIPAALSAQVQSAIDADGPRLIEIYKHIHANPELPFMEKRTAGIVAKGLSALGYEVKTGIGKTGVVGILRNGPGPVVMYRADMDAVPVEEATGLPYASKVTIKREDDMVVPVSHMCGHDAHTTWMLGVAKAMAGAKDAWSGTLVMVGQPAEEVVRGAKAMVDDGLYTKHGVPVPGYLIALHTAPGPVGTIVSTGGPRFAGSDKLNVIFRGIGGHGGMPHLAKDPIIMAAAAIMEYQVIVARAIDPQEAAVLTVGAIQAGTAHNVIPDRALLKINLRSFKPQVRDQMIKGIRSISESIARAYGLPDNLMPTIEIVEGSVPPLWNDTPLIARLNGPLKGLLGEKRVLAEFPAATGSEDAHMLKGDHPEIPLAYIIVGVADPDVFAKARKEGKTSPYSPHNPNYRVDLTAIPLGAKVGTLSVLELLAK